MKERGQTGRTELAVRITVTSRVRGGAGDSGSAFIPLDAMDSPCLDPCPRDRQDVQFRPRQKA